MKLKLFLQILIALVIYAILHYFQQNRIENISYRIEKLEKSNG